MIEKLKMEKKAVAFREKYSIPATEPIRYRDLLEKLGVITCFLPLSEGVSGMAIKADEYRFMLVNRKTTVGRQNFTIGHELYHLFEQENFTAKVCSQAMFSKADKEEYHADLFSTYLLLPNDGVLNLIPEQELSRDKITLETILKVEQTFKCSRTAILYRLKDLGILTEGYAEQFNTDIAKNAMANGYPRDLYFSVEEDDFIGNDYISTLKQLFDAGKMKEIEFINSMYDIGKSEI